MSPSSGKSLSLEVRTRSIDLVRLRELYMRVETKFCLRKVVLNKNYIGQRQKMTIIILMGQHHATLVLNLNFPFTVTALSKAQALESSLRNPLQAWVSVHISFVCTVFCR
jgi:hypothetical protein